jgi:hypothetical protein
VSGTEYYGPGAKLQVLSTEQSAVNTGCKMRRAEKSAICKRYQASTTEQSVTGAELECRARSNP